MPFGNAAGPTIVYSYYARKPIVGLEIVREQFSRAHKYKNKLIELERLRREQYADLAKAHYPDIEIWERLASETDEEIAAIRAEIKKQNAGTRKRTGTAEQQERVRVLREQRREAMTEIRKLKREAKENEVFTEELARLNAEHHERQKRERAASGLYWGNYLSVESDIPRTGPPPRFHRWDGGGKVCVQIQHGLTMEEVFGCKDNRLRIVPTDVAAYQPERPSCAHKRMMRTMAMMRIGSDERGAPVWAEIPILMHRLPPADARVKWAYLVRRPAAGTSENWSFQLVLEREEGWGDPLCAKDGSVDVRIGWKLTQDGFSVATIRGDDGYHGDVILPRVILDKWQHSESLGALRRNGLNQQLEHLQEWLAEQKDKLPDWLREQTAHLAQWRSAGKLAWLLQQWREERVTGDGEIVAALEVWNRDDLHLKRWEYAEREKCIEMRNEEYRRLAAHLRRAYRTIRISGWSIAKLLKKPEAEDNRNSRGARLYQRIAAPGLLRQLIKAKAAACESLGDEPDPAGTRSAEAAG